MTGCNTSDNSNAIFDSHGFVDARAVHIFTTDDTGPGAFTVIAAREPPGRLEIRPMQVCHSSILFVIGDPHLGVPRFEAPPGKTLGLGGAAQPVGFRTHDDERRSLTCSSRLDTRRQGPRGVSALLLCLRKFVGYLAGTSGW